MPEPVRLVVWDLDGTFWAGTLTEGGHTYSDTNHNIIVELAKRGIVSSICSKNDFETIKAILVERGIWDYFVFPSISWNAKGPRLKRLVEDVQLRPETILLLDDNPLNLREAEHFVPGLQTADDTFIPQILESPLFKGKKDAEFSRLKQYKLLETRKADEAVAEDNFEFLRSCDIRVTIEQDIEKHADRVIELINRTNQLNFTKKRLPEDPVRARKKLLESLDNFDAQAGLVHVKDRYGDYGYCGFYETKTRKGRTRLRHFCFSCRILNMGVESWLYERLGRPAIEVQGEVLTDLSKPAEVDWISLASSDDGTSSRARRDTGISRVIVRGACTVSPLVHYFTMDVPEVVGEFNEVRDGIQVRLDHSLTLRYAIEGLSVEQLEILRPLGFTEAHFQTSFADASAEPALRILSNWIDEQPVLHRHKETGLLIPFKTKASRGRNGESTEQLPAAARQAVQYLHDNFEPAGAMSAEESERTFDAIFGAVPKDSPLFVITAPTKRKSGAELKQRTETAVARHPDKLICPLAIADLADEDEWQTGQHFDRSVYLRLYEEIWARYRELSGGARQLPPGGGRELETPLPERQVAGAYGGR